jgi:hypothetical protein
VDGRWHWQSQVARSRVLGVRDEQRKNRGKARTKAWKEKKRGKEEWTSFVVLLLYIKKYVGSMLGGGVECGIVEGVARRSRVFATTEEGQSGKKRTWNHEQ